MNANNIKTQTFHKIKLQSHKVTFMFIFFLLQMPNFVGMIEKGRLKILMMKRFVFKGPKCHVRSLLCLKSKSYFGFMFFSFL